MIPEAQIGALLRLAISLLLLVGVCYMWHETRLAALRQSLFKLRDDLFQEAEDGVIAFDHPAYGTMRTLLNGFIRFAHRLNLTTLVIAHAAYRLNPRALDSSTTEERLAAHVQTLPDEHSRWVVLGTHRRLQLLVVKHLVLGSPLLLLLVGGWLCKQMTFELARTMRVAVAKGWRIALRINLHAVVGRQMERAAGHFPGMREIEEEAHFLGHRHLAA